MRLIRFVMMSFLALAPLALAGVARADACLGGGGPPDEPPPRKDGSAVGMGETAPHQKTPVRLAGGGLMFLGGLGSVWLAARRQGDTGRRRSSTPPV